jgi:hypothetical protein
MVTDPLHVSSPGTLDTADGGGAAVAPRDQPPLAGPAERAARWLRSRRTGPIARLRRVGRVGVDMARSPRFLPALPGALREALRGPASEADPPRSRAPRSFDAERTAAEDRLRAFSSRMRSNAGHPRMALIADDLLTTSLAEAWDVVAVRPEDWIAALAEAVPDVLLVESAWRANSGAWQYRIAWYAHPDAITPSDLRALLGWCAAHGVPSVFWDTAGAAQTGRFRESALLFDLIVTGASVAPTYLGAIERHCAAVAVAGEAAAPADGIPSLCELIERALRPA